jgi:hypothetical protein
VGSASVGGEIPPGYSHLCVCDSLVVDILCRDEPGWGYRTHLVAVCPNYPAFSFTQYLSNKMAGIPTLF